MVRVISLSNEAYEKLKSLKGRKSFSELIVDLLNRKVQKKNIMEFAGIWKDDKYWENFNKEVKKTRKNSKLKEVRL